MTFTKRPMGLLVGLFSFFIATSFAMASKQVITCEERINVVLFGLQSPYGETFDSGLANVSNDGSSSTISAQNRLDEAHQANALFSGNDYEGNTISIQLPKAIIGKSAEAPFPVLAKLVLNKSKEEKTLEIRCLSQVGP
jgi:hypothetical protein